MIAADSGLIAPLSAIFGNHRRGNTGGLSRAKAGKAILNHQTLAGVEIELELAQRRQINRRMWLSTFFIICAGNHVEKVPERELVQHSGNNLAG